ncbi:MAG TPA: nucleotidyltransferase domain-containing protein [Ignavibacteriales bacterium]|nr:nucleotidyltransferase domain-containing protein [Ignavibacteriales bacterium]
MLSEDTISFIKSRLLENFQLDKIILFGSQARGDADDKSDIDLLVLTPEIKNRRRLMLEIDRKLKGLGFARDIVVLKDDEFERDKLIPGTIARYAFLEGRVLYER